MAFGKFVDACENAIAIVGQTVIQHVVLLFMRLWWGWNFFQAGFGKLKNIDHVIDFFSSLGIPWPEFNAYFVGTCETVFGLLLMLGLFSRIAAVPLTIIMIVAYGTADLDSVLSIFTNPALFIKQEPFMYLLTALLVWCFGPGFFSLDRIFRHKS